MYHKDNRSSGLILFGDHSTFTFHYRTNLTISDLGIIFHWGRSLIDFPWEDNYQDTNQVCVYSSCYNQHPSTLSPTTKLNTWQTINQTMIKTHLLNIVSNGLQIARDVVIYVLRSHIPDNNNLMQNKRKQTVIITI